MNAIEIDGLQMEMVRQYASPMSEATAIPREILEKVRQFHPCRLFPEGAVRWIPDMDGTQGYRLLLHIKIIEGRPAGNLAFVWRENLAGITLLSEMQQRKALEDFSCYAQKRTAEGAQRVHRLISATLRRVGRSVLLAAGTGLIGM